MITVLFFYGIVFMAYGYCGTQIRGGRRHFGLLAALPAAAFHTPALIPFSLFSASAGSIHTDFPYPDSAYPRLCRDVPFLPVSKSNDPGRYGKIPIVPAFLHCNLLSQKIKEQYKV